MADRGGAPASAGLSRWQTYGLVALLLVLSNVPLACLVVLWPERADLTGLSRVHLLGWSWSIATCKRQASGSNPLTGGKVTLNGVITPKGLIFVP